MLKNIWVINTVYFLKNNMDTRQLFAEYIGKVKNSNNKKEWEECFLFLDEQIKEREWEVKETFIKMKDRMRDYFNKMKNERNITSNK
jgi:hypothetical protein